MLQDIATSRDINIEFRNKQSEAGQKMSLDFSINVLATVCVLGGGRGRVIRD
jgi:hypothetical protein